MAKSDTAKVAVTTFADHEIIVPRNPLRSAVVTVNAGAADDLDPIARAEAALAQLSQEFESWMQTECERLDRARHDLHLHGWERERDSLFRVAHDIKGEAATFGFPLAADAADSLCRLIEHTPELTHIPSSLIDQHVDSIRAIARDSSDASKGTARALVARLRSVTDEFLVHENRHRPDYLDGIVALAPPLVPEQ